MAVPIRAEVLERWGLADGELCRLWLEGEGREAWDVRRKSGDIEFLHPSGRWISVWSAATCEINQTNFATREEAELALAKALLLESD